MKEHHWYWRPYIVGYAQAVARFVSLFTFQRVITYSIPGAGTIPLRVRYLSVELEDGRVLWENPWLDVHEKLRLQQLREVTAVQRNLARERYFRL